MSDAGLSGVLNCLKDSYNSVWACCWGHQQTGTLLSYMFLIGAVGLIFFLFFLNWLIRTYNHGLARQDSVVRWDP